MADWQPIADIAADVNSGKLKATDLVKKSLKLIEENKDYSAIISTLEDRALARAAEIDKNPAGRLAGVPFIAKDNFLAFGGKTTAASNILRPFEAPYQATAIERLEAEGAICVAKANLDAFAHGASTENSDFFVTKNPHDKNLVPGGSSGGSAASVALKIAPLALGTDTGGSSRQPASFCGVVGYKPTYGLISRSGVVAMASSTDTIGTLTANVDDLSIAIDIMAGRDQLDSTTIERDKESYLVGKGDLKSIKFGLVNEYMDDGVDQEVKDVINQAVDKIKTAGALVEMVSLSSLPLALPAYYIVCPAEVSSNLSRYDGQRYGYYSQNAKNLEESYELSRDEGFGAEAKRRIMIGTYVLSAGYYEAYYRKAQMVRTKLINEFEETFSRFDFLLGPVAPTTAFKIGQNSSDPLKMYLADILTVAVNMTGHPSISVPAGLSNGLPVGLQIIGPQKADRQLLAVAKSFGELS